MPLLQELNRATTYAQPCRLSETTRELSRRGLAGEFGLLRAFLDKGGFYLNVDVMDSAVLLDAQENPENYPNLAVRVSGWCARFNTLTKEWQDMVIQRTQQFIQ